MQEDDDTMDSSTDDTSSTEDESQGRSLGISQDMSGCRIVTEDPDGAEINISGQAFVSFRIQLCGKGNKGKEGFEKEEKDGRGKRKLQPRGVQLQGRH